MIIAKATLNPLEHARLINDLGHLEVASLIEVSREGDITTINPTSEDGSELLKRTFKDGLLRTWGYHKKFTITEVVTA